MPLAELTREEIRVRVGYILGGIKELEADASGSTTTFLTDDIAIATADDPNGMWLVFTSGTNDGSIRQITNMTASSNQATLTFHPAVAASTADGDTAELWSQWYDPAAIHNFINQSIDDIHGAFYDPVEDISLHGGSTFRYDIPTSITGMLSDVYVRSRTTSRQVIAAGVVWDESVDSDFTVAIDPEDLLFGRTTTKFTIGSGVSAGDLASDAIGSIDLSKFTHIEFPIKVRDTVASADLVLRLSATANGADTDKIITIPGITQDTDTWVRVAMTDSFNPSAATAIISVALEYNANQGDNIVWMGEIVATVADEDQWEMLDNVNWRVDKQARDLIILPSFSNGGHGHNFFSHRGHDFIGYRLLKLVGGDNPVKLTSDATTSEVPEDYIIYKAAGLAMERPIRGETEEMAKIRMNQADRYAARSEQARRKFPILRNVRTIL